MDLESTQRSQNEVAPVSVEKLTEELAKLMEEKEKYVAILKNRENASAMAVEASHLLGICREKIEIISLTIERAELLDEIATMENHLKDGADLMGKRGDSVATTERTQWVASVYQVRRENEERKKRIFDIDAKLARFVPNNTEVKQLEETV